MPTCIPTPAAALCPERVTPPPAAVTPPPDLGDGTAASAGGVAAAATPSDDALSSSADADGCAGASGDDAGTDAAGMFAPP